MVSNTITITVTQEDIDAASRDVGLRIKTCPIARVLRRHPSRADWYVGQDCICVEGRDDIPLPAQVVAFIANVDLHRPVSPISFTIEVPE